MTYNPFFGDINGQCMFDDDSYFGFGQDDNAYDPPRKSNSNELIEFECKIKHETEKAYLIKAGESEPFWVPKSQSKKTKNGIKVPKWLYEKKEIEE